MKKNKPHKNKANSGPGFLLPLLNRKQYKQEVKRRTRYEFNPLDRAIQGDLAGSQTRQAQIPGWFQQYRDAVSGAANKTAAAYQQANTDFTNQANQAAQTDTAARQDMQNQAAQDAQKRGVPMDYSGAQAALEAANARQQLQSRFAGTVSTIGANQAGYLADKDRIGAGEMINQLLKEQARERGIRNDLRALAQKKGDYASQLASDLRENDRKYSLGQQTLKGEMSRAQLSAATSTANSKRTASTSRRGQDISSSDRARSRKQQGRQEKQRKREQARQDRERKRHDKASEKHKGKKG